MTTSAMAVERPVPRRGWLVVAQKEFADHVGSVRFVVLLVVMALVAAVPLYFAAGEIRKVAPLASGSPAIFIYLFSFSPADFTFLRVDTFVTLIAPLLGVAFAFDSVNGERAAGTLPRLVAQPIHRDDVINGKFTAGLAVISLVLGLVVVLIFGVGMLQLGIVPSAAEIIRIVLWFLATVLYVGLWLAFGLLLSVVIRRAANAALIGFGMWFLIVFLGQLIVTLIGRIVAPNTGTVDIQISNAGIREAIERILPSRLYSEITILLLDPSATQKDISTPGSIGQIVQAQQVDPSTILSLDQSILLVWPQVVVLVALTVVCFTIAYIRFMRQEVRA